MKTNTLFCHDNDRTLVMNDDVFESIGLDLNEIRLTGYALVDERVVIDYFKKLGSLDYRNDDFERSATFDCDFDRFFFTLAEITRKFVGFEFEVCSMEDGLYVWDWRKFDNDEVMMMED